MGRTRLENQLRKFAKLQREKVMADIGPALQAFTEKGVIPKNPKIRERIAQINDFFNAAKTLPALPTMPSRSNTIEGDLS